MQKLQLSIPEPCHESWQQMTPTQQGRFCNACAKEVIDFSTMTDIQVLNYFTNLTHENVCGRALPEQLDKTISRPEQPKKRLFWYWNYVVMFFMFFAKGNTAKAQAARTQSGGVQVIKAADLEKIKSTNINNALAGKIAGVVVSQIVNGKVTDKDGNPVSFASVKIKGTGTGVSADANGAYSLKVNSNSILTISAAGFKELEVSVGIRTELKSVMQKNTGSGVEGLIIATVGGMSFRNSDDYYGPEDRLNNVAILAVKDETSGKAIERASIVITKNSRPDAVLTDKKGIYKLKGIKKYKQYFIKVTADGYEPNEFTVAASDFKDRKKEWEVLLRKLKVETTRPIAKVTYEPRLTIRGGMIAWNVNNEPLYVIDGTIMSKKTDINPDDIENISVLKSGEATALFGSDGVNGAILVTTRKSKEKILDTVAVSSTYEGRRTRMGAMTGGVSIVSTANYFTDAKAKIKTLLSDSLKVYPNPAMRNSNFAIALKLKEAGEYQLQFSDATGRVVLQKQFNTTTKNHTETVTPQNWAAGIYHVRIFNKNKLISKTSFIFK